MASFISSWHSAMAFSILCGAVAGDRHLFYSTKKSRNYHHQVQKLLCHTLQASKCRLIIGSSYFNLIQVLVSHFSYKIEVWKHVVKSCGNKGLMERQTTDRCICVLIISACLQILFSDSQPASEPSDKFQAVESRKDGAQIPVVRLASLDICFDCLFCSLICDNMLNLSHTSSNFHIC